MQAFWKPLVALGALALSGVLPAFAGSVAGRVVSVADAKGIAQAMVTLEFAEGSPGAAAVTGFSDGEGRFALAGNDAQRLQGAVLRVSKPGYEVADTSVLSLSEETDTLRIFLKPTDNIASSVPASAWFEQTPAGDERNITIASCSSCHQMASPRVREYAAQIEAVSNGPDGDRKALEEWRKLVRHESWRAVVKYMRAKHYAVLPLESPVNLDVIDWPTAKNEDYNFFNLRQGEMIAQFLADHFPRTTDYLQRDAYEFGAPLVATENLRIREYAFPKMALVREMVPAPGSKYLWGADVMRNQIVRLDPDDGSTRWYAPEFDGSTGPHTIVPDDDGDLWISMIDNDQFARFEPDAEKWTMWTLRPTDLADDQSIGGAALVHDMSIDSRGHLARDPDGYIWITLVGSNQMGVLHPDTGEVAFYDTNKVEGMSPVNHLIYATILSPDGQCAWYSQVNGHVGCINTKTKKIDKLVEFKEGTGPRRMTLDRAGHLWVTLFGSGQVAKIRMDDGKLLATYDLPDRSSAPYALSWDETRQVLWVVTANGDVIYRLDPATGLSTVLPLPRPMAYLRQIAVDGDNGQLVASYGNYPEGSGPSYGVVIDPGDTAEWPGKKD